LRQLLLDWSLRLALQVGLMLELVQLEAVLPLRVLPAAAVVAAPAPSLLQAVAALRLLDSSVPEPPDSSPQLPAALVLEAELARTKSTRTRVTRDR
jgi:hypothetical protein